MNQGSEAARESEFATKCYAISRAIHWITVLLMTGVLVTALFGTIDPHGSGNEAFRWHSSLGLGVYLLAVSRVFLWIVYRPAIRKRSGAKSGVDTGLRIAFYALLVALPISGWILASEEGMATHKLAIPMLPQWYHHEDATPSARINPEISPNIASREDPRVSVLAHLHGALAAILSVAILLHVVSAIGQWRSRHETKSPLTGS